MNKEIKRDGQTANKIFDNRSLENDYRTLVPILKEGMKVLDVGCGTGAISKGVAERVRPSGSVTGIDTTEAFIISGKETYKSVSNLELIHADLFQYEPKEKFDLIVSARTLQWLSTPKEALIKMKSMLKPGGLISILDYNHEALEWKPAPPASMQQFYATFLRWRADAGMNNHIAEDLADYLKEAGFTDIEVVNSDEVYKKAEDNFLSKVGIWAKVAGSTQMVEEGYLDDMDRLKAIEEYNHWIETDAELMVMKLNEVRGINR
ncbi:MAG: methyltransferase domain-containing protein [Sphingobacteriaceae bacterium]|nr:methyltransferase domain-containing protein [Sphingobacteriaceae bacterium]